MNSPHWRNGLRTRHKWSSAIWTPTPITDDVVFAVVACWPPEELAKWI